MDVAQPIYPKGPLLVIGVGLMRTGTTSMKFALETLYDNQAKCYHMREIILGKRVHHFKMWESIAEELMIIKKRNPKARISNDRFYTFFEEFRFTTDIPPCLFFKELIEVYPNAKFIYTERDVDSWLESCRKTVISKEIFSTTSPGQIILEFIGPLGKLKSMMKKIMKYGLNLEPDDILNDEKLKDAFIKHKKAVFDTIPSDRLLHFDPKNGWEPLCKFLGRPVPKIPYPHLNTKEEIQVMLAEIKKKVQLINALVVLLIAFLIMFLFYLK